MFDASTIILDLDGTLFDFENYIQDMRYSAQRMGIHPDAVSNTYVQAWTHPERKSGYHQAQHARLLCDHCNHEEDALQNWLESHHERFGDYVFPDTHLFLDEMKQEGHNIVLLTHGDPKFQLRKFRGIGIDDYFDAVYATRAHKKDFLQDWMKTDGSNMLFINDNPDENMVIAHEFPRMRQVMRTNLAQWEEKLYNKIGFPHFPTLHEISVYARAHFPG